MLEIIVVEDQPAVREIIGEVLGSLNLPMHIDEAINIKEAEQKLKQQSWDILVTDLSLGDGNSLDLLQQLKQEDISTPPVILVSGFLSASHMRQARAMGIQHVLAKPFDPDVLLDHVRSVLELEKRDMNTTGSSSNTHRLLPEVFEMDRKLGLLFRMFDEMPKNMDVTSVCQSALNLAMDMVHAQGGYIALFERHKERLVRIASKGLHDKHTSHTCRVQDTPFHSLIHDSEEFIETSPSPEAAQTCWPDVHVKAYIGVPIYLQGIPMGVLCLVNRLDNKPLQGENKHMLGLLVKKLDTLLDNRAVHAALADSMNQTLIALVRSLEARDRYTKDHSSRVSHLSVLFAQKLGLDEESIQLIRTGGLLHDIGKVGIADSVLLKPGRYTEQEYAIMKAHPAIGDSILMNMDTLARERLIVRHHHERWDGQGYPDKIGGTEIPFEARIVCVADAIDAMTTHRVYRQAKPLSFCAEQLAFASGSQFDPQIVEVALQAIEQGEIDTQAMCDNCDEGVLPIQASLTQALKQDIPKQIKHIKQIGAHHA